MRFLIIFIFFISKALASEIPNIKNVVINKELKTYDNIVFLDSKEKIIKLSDYKGNLVMLNFWATWCAPCKEEMPSLDALAINPKLPLFLPFCLVNFANKMVVAEMRQSSERIIRSSGR